MFLRIELRSKKFYDSTIRNRLLLQVIHFRNAFEAVALQSSQRLPELLFYTKKSYKILQAPIPAPIPAPMLHVHITLQSREFSIQNPFLHAEDKELFEYYSPVSRNSTHRRQGDLLEIHPCVLQDIPGNSSCSRDIQDIPVIHDLPAFPGNSTMFQYLQGIHPISAFSD